VFVARAFALFHQPRTDPPHERMKPEDRLDDHVNWRGEVIAPLDVTRLVRQHRFELWRREMLLDACGHQQNRTPHANSAGFQQVRRRTDVNVCRKTHAWEYRLRARAYGRADAPPTENSRKNRVVARVATQTMGQSTNGAAS
jgi:hypothetical protein